MSDQAPEASTNQWREKYLNALDAQEVQERENRQQQDLLRRALARISSSVEGQDEALDRALTHLSEVLRQRPDDLRSALNQVDQVLEDYEQRRHRAQQEFAAAIGHTLDPLRNLAISRGLNAEIRHYLSQLPERAQKPRLYPALLEHLADIQRQALDQLKNPTDLRALVQKISALLSEWIAQIDVPERLELKVKAIQQRLTENVKGGEDVFALLEAVRNLMVEAYIGSNQAFASYLNLVNGELNEIYAALGGAVDQQARQVKSAQDLQDSVLKQVEEIESGTASATDLDELKNQVRSQLGNIRSALDQYQKAGQHQEAFSRQLQELVEKIKTMEDEAQKSRAILEKQRYKALHDPLTELPNREAYNERIQEEFKRWQRYQNSLSIAVCDIDYFKKINDSFGHQAGDRVLKVISRSIAQRLREVDFFGRYGGEEFVVILPETNLEKAYLLLEKIRLGIAKTAFNYKKAPLVITLSFGITQLRHGDTAETAFARADKALYAAKAAGRNRCEIFE